MSADEEVVDLAADTASIATARRFVARAFSGRVPREVIADLVLATSELVTNAIEHGDGRGQAAPVRVTVHVDAGQATVAVRSPGDPHLGDPGAWDLPDPDVRTGRGLGIVRQMSDHVEVVQGSGEVEITAARRW